MSAYRATLRAAFSLIGIAASFAVAYSQTDPGPTLSVDYGAISWTPVAGATFYDLVRGDVATLRQTGGDFTAALRVCLAGDTNLTSEPYQGVPAPGQAFFFLVSGVTTAGAGTYDDPPGTGQVGTRDPEIEAAATACNPPWTARGRIAISGDSQFTPSRGVTSGTGTAADPYVVSDWDIHCNNRNGTAAIEIDDVTVPFVVRNVSLQDCQYGVLMNNVADATLMRLWITNDDEGIQITNGNGVTIDHAGLALSGGTGIALIGGDGDVITRSNISGAALGIDLEGVTGAGVYHNNIGFNTQQAADHNGSGNVWDHGYPDGGNYWTDDTGEDLRSGPAQDLFAVHDGIIDLPYQSIDAGVDRYPLVSQAGDEGDTQPPGVTIASPAPGQVSLVSSITVQGNSTDVGRGVDHVQVSVNGGPWTPTSCVLAWTIQVALTPGANTISAQAVDHVGNVSPVRSVTIDYDPPVPWQTRLETDAAGYEPGTTVAMTLSVTNLGATTGVLDFPSSCQASFAVTNASGSPVYDAKSHSTCFPGTTRRFVPPGGTITYALTWTQVNDAGTQVPSGSYTLRGTLTSTETVPDASDSITIATTPWQSSLQTDAASYPPGTPVAITLSITNPAATTRTLNFPTTCEALFSVANAGGTSVFDLSRHVGCFEVFVTETVPAGGTITYHFTWSQANDSGTQVPVPGDYTIRGYLTSYETVPDAVRTITVSP